MRLPQIEICTILARNSQNWTDIWKCWIAQLSALRVIKRSQIHQSTIHVRRESSVEIEPTILMNSNRVFSYLITRRISKSD